MTDLPKDNIIDAAIPLLQNFVNSENYKLLKIIEKKEFDKILNFMAEQIKREQQGKVINPQKFHQELTKKLARFNRSIDYNTEQALADAGLIKQRKLSPKQQTIELKRKANIKNSIINIVQNLPKPPPPPVTPKPLTRSRRVGNAFMQRMPTLRKPVVFRSGLLRRKKQSQEEIQVSLQTEFKSYADKLVEHANRNFGVASKAFSESMPTSEATKSQKNTSGSLVQIAKLVGAGDFIHRAHDYPLSRDQSVIDAVNAYEMAHKDDQNNELMTLCQAIAGVNSLRQKIDKVYETFGQPGAKDVLPPSIMVLEAEAKDLEKHLNKIQNPEIQKIAKEVIKLSDKITQTLPQDIKLEVQQQKQMEEQTAKKMGKKGSPNKS